jgi:hypothetical protein
MNMITVAKVTAALAVMAAIAFGSYQAGSNAVMVDWGKERAAQAERLVADERAARAEEQRLADESIRITAEQASRERVASDRAARAERAAVGLRDEIARLNARPAPKDAEAAGFAHEAGVARELLGACTKEYQSLARESDGLGDQVTGLQQWVASTQGSIE